MKTIFHMSEYHPASGTAHFIGHANSIDELPEIIRPVVAADPDAEEWSVPIPDAPGLELVVQRRAHES